jgi:hypothetical protein
MNIDIILQFISTLIPTIGLFFILKERTDRNYSFLHSRIRKLEKEISCLRAIIRINIPRFSDQFNKSMEEYEEKLNDK